MPRNGHVLSYQFIDAMLVDVRVIMNFLLGRIAISGNALVRHPCSLVVIIGLSVTAAYGYDLFDRPLTVHGR